MNGFALVAGACLALVIVTTIIHYEGLRLTSALLPRLRIPPRTKLIVVIVGAFSAHTIEIVLYAAATYLLVLRFAQTSADAPTLVTMIYFSAETYASLGYGDLAPHGVVRLLAGVEALNGLLLIGWSASFTFVAMERFWAMTPRRSRDDSGVSD